MRSFVMCAVAALALCVAGTALAGIYAASSEVDATVTVSGAWTSVQWYKSDGCYSGVGDPEVSDWKDRAQGNTPIHLATSASDTYGSAASTIDVDAPGLVPTLVSHSAAEVHDVFTPDGHWAYAFNLGGANWLTSGATQTVTVTLDYSYDLDLIQAHSYAPKDSVRIYVGFWDPGGNLMLSADSEFVLEGNYLVKTVILDTAGSSTGTVVGTKTWNVNVTSGAFYSFWSMTEAYAWTIGPPYEAWIDDDYCDGCPNDGHIWGYDAFSDIQSGIDAVGGSIVNVAPGVYSQRLTISNTVDLRGAQYGVDPTQPGARTNPANESIINMTGLAYANPNMLISVGSAVSSVSIDGFTLDQNQAWYMADECVIRAWDDYITVSNNIMSGTYGIVYKGNDYLTVDKNSMVVNKSGVVVQPNPATNVTLSDNLFALGPSPIGDESAMYLTGTNQADITGNTATGFVNGRGVGGSNLTNVTMSGNSFTGNRDAVSFWGNTTFITITDNDLSNSSRYGINIKGQDITISGNVIDNCGNAGINVDRHVIDTERVSVTGNSIAGNTNYGVYVNTSLVTETVDAEANWWGAASGPVHASNPGGSGDAAGDGVDYSPWWGVDYVGDAHVSPWTWYTNDSIVDAIDLASAGDDVNVLAGTYAENVLVDKALTLTGIGMPEIVPGAGNGVEIEASDVTVDGFEIHECAHGIEVWLPPPEYNVSPGYTNLRLLNNLIWDINDGAWGFGIYVGTESERYNPGHGMYDPTLTDLLDFTGLEIVGNTITSTSGASIVLQSMRSYTSTPLKIHSNHVHLNAMSAIWIDGSWDLDFVGNRLHNNSNGVFFSNYGDGYYETTPDNAYDPKNIAFSGNIIHSNSSHGVAMWDAYPGEVTFTGNSIYGNSTGFENYLGVAAAAEGNWWGDPSGPHDNVGTHEASPGVCYDPSIMKNDDGLGNSAKGLVDYCPWFTGNIICTPDPQELTNAEPVKTVDVDYVGGGGGLVYGYSLKFSWDGGVVSTAPVSVTEGSLLSDQGLTQFFALASGANEITVDCVLLGDQPGVTGPGTMFTIEFTGLACGVSDIDVTVIKVRDKANNSLGGFYEDDGEIIVDMVNPVFTINDPWPDGECYNVSPVLDLSASDACGDLHDAFYRIDGGAWASDAGLFTGYSGSAWSNSAWTLPGFGVLAEGPHTVEFYCDDDVGNPSAVVGWDFIKDTIDPSAVSDFDASPGHEKVHLSWTNPGGGPGDFDHVVVVRKPWSGGSPYGYPEYVQPADGYPAGPGDGAVVYSGTGSSYDDPVADRSIYFYRAFVYDCAGNYNGGTSPGGDIPPGFAQGDRSTNYWLGDMTDGVGFTGSYDGLVDFNDINGLSACYWLYSPGSPPGSPHNECDVGPTDDNSRLGLPVPDDYIDFEDLMIFAMNYGVVSPLGAPVLEREELGPVVLRLESTGAIDNELVVSLVLGGNVDEVKGVSVVLEYDTESLVLESATRSSGLAGGLVFFDAREGSSGEVWIDVAALGRGQVVRGSGELARLVFSVAGTSPEVKFAEAEIRGVDNRPLDAVSESYEAEVVPALTRLLGARPNPFGPGTTVQYELSRSEHVLVEVYDARGRLVRELVDGVLDAGSYSERWDGLDSRGTAVHGGVYFVKMRAGGYESTSKLVKLQ